MIRDTSRQAYNEIKHQGITDRQSLSIMFMVRGANKIGIKPTRRDVSLQTGIESSSVSARVNSLIKCGFIEEGEQVKRKGYRAAYELIATE